MISFSLAISHLPKTEERRASMQRLRDALGIPRGNGVLPCVYKEFSDPAPNHVWSAEMWQWAALENVTHHLFLQDDAVVAPDFWKLLHDMVSTRPFEVIGLHVGHPAAVPLAEEGESWFTTCDGLIGLAYVVERETLKRFLEWRSEALQPDAVENVTEDSLLALFCACEGIRVHHPIPTIVDHDTALPSTYGNDGHDNRRPRVRWDNTNGVKLDEAHWQRSPAPRHLGRFYQSTPDNALKWVRDFTPQRAQALRNDNGAAEQRKLQYGRLARGGQPVAKVFIATPTRGDVSGEYAASIWRLLRDETIELEEPVEFVDVLQWQADVVRTRSRYLRHFLEDTDATHILFADADVSFLPKVLRGMLRTGKDFVACPYPRRDIINWRSLAGLDPATPPEAAAYRYSVTPVDASGEFRMLADGTVEVAAMPLGMALISRKGAEQVTEHYRKELEFYDQIPGGTPRKTVAVFQLMFTETRGLLSEDFSFSRRFREAGGKVWMYLGEGSPVNHWGMWGFKGQIEAFGLTRGRK